MLAGVANGQTSFDRSLKNPTTEGSRQISCTFWTPPATISKPWPVVVLVHGYGFVGRDYKTLGRRMAADGFLVVAPNTAKIDGWLQGLDVLALPTALAAENKATASPLHRAMDLTRRAVVGHSMGGANVVRILAEDSSWSVGIAITPLMAPSIYSPRVRTPLVLVGSESDTITPWRTNLLGIRSHLSKSIPAWVSVIHDKRSNHVNPVFRDYAGSNADDDAVFDATYEATHGALRRWIRDEPHGLDSLVGSTARKSSVLQLLEHRFLNPEHYSTRDSKEYRLHVVGADGPVLELGAFQQANIPTVFGDFGLAPHALMVAPALSIVGGRATTLGFVRDRRFDGLKVWFQSLSFDARRSLRLGRVLRGKLGTR